MFVAPENLQLSVEVVGNNGISEEPHRIDGLCWASWMSRVVPITLQTIRDWSVNGVRFTGP
jgi:hypothetical protein